MTANRRDADRLAVDRPEVVAEVAAAFAGYERALVAGDAEEICDYFWDSPDVVRFGIGDHQYGIAEQRAWRRAQGALPPGRRLHETRITAFGADTAVVTTFFTYPDAVTRGRQSQTWIRLAAGWRIVSAHVSEPTAGPGAPAVAAPCFAPDSAPGSAQDSAPYSAPDPGWTVA